MGKTNKKPKIIVASSGIQDDDLVSAISINLNQFADTHHWSIGRTKSDSTVEKLADEGFSYAVVINTTKDFSDGNTVNQNSYETGLLAGKIGTKKVFVVLPDDYKVSPESDELEYITYSDEWEKNSERFREIVDRIITRVGEVAEEEDEFDSSIITPDLLDEDIVYNIYVLNEAGDAIIQKTVTSLVKSGSYSERIHEIFSDSPQSYRDLHLEAYDLNRVRLDTKRKKEKESQIRKQFVVSFLKEIQPTQRYTYSIKYQWKSMFPKGNSYFVTKIASSKLIFNLHIPFGWKLKKISLKIRLENKKNRRKVFKPNEVKLTNEVGLFDVYQIGIPNIEPGSRDVQLEWEG